MIQKIAPTIKRLMFYVNGSLIVQVVVTDQHEKDRGTPTHLTKMTVLL